MSAKKKPFTKAEWKKLNRRRCSLIDKKYDKGLTTQEAKELEMLQKKADLYVGSFEGPSVAMLLRQVRGLKRQAHSALASLSREKHRAYPHRNRIFALMDKKASRGLTKREKAELARLQKDGISWTMLEAERNPPTAEEVKRMDHRTKEFSRKLLGKE